MWTDRSPGQRASRVAIAGSIYMRKASLQLFKSRQLPLQNAEGQKSRRNPSCGKIVKNMSKKNQYNKLIDQINFLKVSPLKDNKNIFSSTFQLQYKRKTPTPSFGNNDDYQQSKIRSIQQKYRNMLSEYEIKKKTINSQLNSIRSSQIMSKENTKKTPPSCSNSACKPTGIKSNRSQKKQNKKNHENLMKEYQKHSKQLIIEKLSGQSKNLSKKKPKITQLYPYFFQSLKKQIKLQEQLRVLKYSMSEQKKQQVQKILVERHGQKYNNLLDLDQQQFDPFQNKKQAQMSADDLFKKLIEKFNLCQQNWKEKVCMITTKDEGKQIFESLNFEKSKQITLKAFVRELSYLLEKHLRNRDLIRIYKRLTPLIQQKFCQTVLNRS